MTVTPSQADRIAALRGQRRAHLARWRGSWRGVPLLGVAACLLAGALLSACGGDATKDNLSGYLGAGAGGPDTSPPLGTVQSVSLTRPDGTQIGTLSYDDGFFAESQPDPAVIGELTDTHTGSGTLTISATHITGRADTPCRFDAAILARDGGYDITDFGGRKNAMGQGLYEVKESKGGSYLALFCANLKDNSGVQLTVTADTPDKLSWLQVFAVLNSLVAQ
jgi:hypothetical protein